MQDTSAPETVTFEPPGPGSWMLDVTHRGRRPVTRFMQPLCAEAFSPGFTALAKAYGLPFAQFRVGYVQGCMYVRMMSIGEPEKPKGAPPAPLMWVVARLHPEMRRRNRAAADAWAQRRWRTEVDAWFDGGGRDRAVAANLAVQAVEPDQLDDDALLAHLDDAVANFRHRALVSFETHGGDLIPVGDFLAHCEQWGVDAADAAALLAGASPSSLETATMLEPVARAVGRTATPPTSVAEVRALGPEVDAAESAWLEQHGRRLLFSDDLDSTTLAESPELQLRALLAAGAPPTPTADPTVVRNRVPAEHRDEFDELLAEARHGLRLRDDNVGVGWNWPAGLVRRALLEVGRRLVERGRLHAAEHALELGPGEVAPLLRSGTGPTIEEMAGRWTHRDTVVAAGPPDMLGPEPPPPPIALLPAGMRRAVGAVEAVIRAMQGAPAAAPLHGTGIGERAYRGRARVIADVTTALAVIDDGDVVVAPFTGPSWNSLLPMVGALVVEEGGPMCHAAIVAREFSIPAVIGVAGATQQVPDGAEVEVDPVAGAVRVLAQPA